MANKGNWTRAWAGRNNIAVDLTPNIGDITHGETMNSEIETIYGQTWQEVIPISHEISKTFGFIHRTAQNRFFDNLVVDGNLMYVGLMWGNDEDAADYCVWAQFAAQSQGVNPRYGTSRHNISLVQAREAYFGTNCTAFDFDNTSKSQTLPTALKNGERFIVVVTDFESDTLNNVQLRIGTTNIGAAQKTGDIITASNRSGNSINTDVTLSAGDRIQGYFFQGAEIGVS